MNVPKWLIKLSIKTNDMCGGVEGYTLCATVWERRLNGSKFYRVVAKVTDGFFLIVFRDNQHCRQSFLKRDDHDWY
jgi:hypothetical protein